MDVAEGQGFLVLLLLAAAQGRGSRAVHHHPLEHSSLAMAGHHNSEVAPIQVPVSLLTGPLLACMVPILRQSASSS